KACGRPLCQLRGGRQRERVEVYLSGLAASTAEERVAAARGAVARGFRGIKLFLGYGLATDLAIVRAVRAAIGPDVRLLVDGHWMYDRATALALGRALEGEGVCWLETPLDPSDL